MLRKTAHKSLFGFRVDGILLGGASVFVMVILELAHLTNDQAAILAALMLVLANFVNHPHFIHSYQIFYGLWLSLPEATNVFRRLWWWAAVIAPCLIASILGYSALKWTQGDMLWMALSINLMGALVGWHYVKQGFGIAMLDAAVKSCFWSRQTRRALLWNAYACWILSWILINGYGGLGSWFWGFFGISITVPKAVLLLSAGVAIFTSIFAIVMLVQDFGKWLQAKMDLRDLPLNGVLAYVVSLYVWTVFSWTNSLFFFVIPFFHSLQYLTVVYRFALNRKGFLGDSARNNFLPFIAKGVLLGILVFWFFPGLIDFFSTGKIPIHSSGAFLAMALSWLFVNVHHYVIDSVLWRRESRRVNEQLLSHLSK